MSLPTLTDEHEMLRRTVRAFVEKEVAPQVDAWEEAGRIPRAFWRRLGELGLLGLEFPVDPVKRAKTLTERGLDFADGR